ncbi:hypothetical protein I302_104037 [Kwoniella bestiolae CBS 10118]|uniref:Uncharacterized protein n=1 Tax=Kwoniella bestiolae CBS 10118 TaxID=1296100 RepID=A0A1B9GA38_9TREE|nr:hypothetical protein I302_02742 [Kwoniella bestiolae CBS 10118]OCF27892.1 hypothetical protein I302_02742 [Kwoniella bestiolae CBS 10118]
MSWAATMTRTENMPGLVLRTRNGFDCSEHSCILSESDHTVPFDKRWNNTSGDPQILNGILSSEEADPTTDQSPNTMLKLVFASRQFKRPCTVPKVEEEAFELVAPATAWPEPDEDSFDLFDRRPTTPETEQRFNRTFNTACRALAALSEDECANIELSYVTTDDFSVEVEDRSTGAWDDHRRFRVVLTDLRPTNVGGESTV